MSLLTASAMNIASTSPDLRRSLAVTALALLPLTLAGCGVVAVAGSVAGAAITVGSAAVSVGATVVTTGVKVTPDEATSPGV